MLEDGSLKRRWVVREVSIRGSDGEGCAVEERICVGRVAWRAKRADEWAEEWVMKEPPESVWSSKYRINGGTRIKE